MQCERHDVHERTIATESGHKRWLRVAGRSDRRGGIQPALVGVAIDLVRVSGLGRLMRSTPYGIDALDVASFAIVAILLMGWPGSPPGCPPVARPVSIRWSRCGRNNPPTRGERFPVPFSSTRVLHIAGHGVAGQSPPITSAGNTRPIGDALNHKARNACSCEDRRRTSEPPGAHANVDASQSI
jgi:hypothetical protein